MDIVLLALILAITAMYSITQICDVYKEIYKNKDKTIENNKNCEISIKDKESK